MRINAGIGIGGVLVVVGLILWSFELRIVTRFGPGHWHDGAIAALLLGAACLALGAYQQRRAADEREGGG